MLVSRLLDLLLDVNNSGQIPPEKRIDLSLDPPSDDEALALDIDRATTPPPGPRPTKSYKKLLREVHHLPWASAAEHYPELVADIEAGRDSPADPLQGSAHPPSFLTADDIDNYLWEIDTRLSREEAAAASAASNNAPNDGTSNDASKPTKKKEPPLPTLAPLAHQDPTVPKDTARDFALRNPVSVYNWLRKNAPKTFLQDGEHQDGGAKEGKDHDGEGGSHGGSGTGSGRRGGKAGGSSERAPRGSGVRSSKRASAASRLAIAESFDDVDDEGYGTPGGAMTPVSTVGGGKGKRKRVVDDDPGYRPKGGSSRPAKKKKKASDVSVGEQSTPTIKKPRKSAGAAAAAAGDGDSVRGADD